MIERTAFPLLKTFDAFNQYKVFRSIALVTDENNSLITVTISLLLTVQTSYHILL